MFGIFNFFSIWFYDAAGYLLPVPELYECFALVALFYLFITYVSPDEHMREVFFRQLPRMNRKQTAQKHDRGSLRWFYVLWIFVFQILVVHTVATALSYYFEATACPLSRESTNSKAVISGVEALSLILCMIGILAFYKRFKPELKEHGALTKLLAFKIIVGITVVQGLVFSILLSTKTLKPSEHLSYNDLSIGLPAFLTCCEVFIFSVIFIFTFSARPYTPRVLKVSGHSTVKRHGFFRALLDVYNLWDIISGIWFHWKVFGFLSRKSGERRNAGFPDTHALKMIDSPDEEAARSRRTSMTDAEEEGHHADSHRADEEYEPLHRPEPATHWDRPAITPYDPIYDSRTAYGDEPRI